VEAAAKTLSALGAAKGGKARAESLDDDQRREIAQKAARARWGDMRKATHVGDLKIAGFELPCAVLEDGTRVLSETGVVKSLGLYRSGAVHVRERETSDGAHLPLFVANKNVKPFVDNELAGVLRKPIWYRVKGAGTVHKGFDAKLLPKVCDVWLKARDAGVLRGSRQPLIAKKADILIRGLADVGIVALVDEATGYQYDRARHALEEILERFIKNELGKWARRFPDEFYEHLFRLKGMKWPSDRNPPQFVGTLTNNVVYKRLAPGVLQELQNKTPKTARGHRRNKYHQWLTEDVGHPKLQEHLASVITLMRVSEKWDDFRALLDKALPKYKELPLLDWAERQKLEESN